MKKHTFKLFRPVRLAAVVVVMAVAASPAPLAAQQQLPYKAEPATQGTTGGEPQPIDGSQGQAITGQGAAEGREDLPDALDTDGDHYNDYAEYTFGTKLDDPSDYPQDMTPEQANADPRALANCNVDHGCTAHGKGKWRETPRAGSGGGKSLKAGKTAVSRSKPGSIIRQHPYVATAAGVGVVGVIAVVASGGGASGGDGGGGGGTGTGDNAITHCDPWTPECTTSSCAVRPCSTVTMQGCVVESWFEINDGAHYDCVIPDGCSYMPDCNAAASAASKHCVCPDP